MPEYYVISSVLFLSTIFEVCLLIFLIITYELE